MTIRSAPLNSHWDGRPEDYDQLRSGWLNQRRLRFVAEQLRAANLPRGGTVLELGSGTGWLLRRLALQFPDQHFVGLEPDATYVEFAERHAKHNEAYFVGVAEEIDDVPLGPVHMLLSNDVLHHVRSLTATFRSAATIADPGCIWLVIEPNCFNPYSFLRQRLTFGERNFVPRSALRAAAESGWRSEAQRNLFLVPPFVRTPPDWMRTLEAHLEGNRVLGGGLAIKLVRG